MLVHMPMRLQYSPLGTTRKQNLRGMNSWNRTLEELRDGEQPSFRTRKLKSSRRTRYYLLACLMSRSLFIHFILQPLVPQKFVTAFVKIILQAPRILPELRPVLLGLFSFGFPFNNMLPSECAILRPFMKLHEWLCVF